MISIGNSLENSGLDRFLIESTVNGHMRIQGYFIAMLSDKQSQSDDHDNFKMELEIPKDMPLKFINEMIKIYHILVYKIDLTFGTIWNVTLIR